MLILGSSLVVYPAASLPLYVKGKVVIVNRETTPFDSKADLVIHDDLGKTFESLAKLI